MAEYTVQVFISHSWSYSEHYDKLAEWVFKKEWNFKEIPIRFIDMSIPKNDPIHNAPNAEALRLAIFRKIQNSHIVIIPTGMYANHSYWIHKEITGAKHYTRPILAVNPWGQEKKSSLVIDNSAANVGWTKDSVVGGVWSLYAKTY